MAHRERDKSDTTSASARLVQLPGRLAQALFTRQLRLTRGDKGLRLVLERTDGAAAPAPAEATAAATAAKTMRADLTILLDNAPGSRKVLRYLAAIESGLKHKDPEGLFLFDVPLERLEPAQRQLEGLLTGAVPAGLSVLRERLSDAVQSRHAIAHDERLRQPLSSFLVDHKLEVADACATDFEQAHANWNAEATGPLHG
jgi:hypothetical protein